MSDQLGQLRNLCARHWNPIGIPMRNLTTLEELGYPPLPEDEYDAYLSEAASMAERGACRDEIIAYLSRCEEYMGLTEPAGDKSAFIDAMFDLVRK